MKKIKIGFVISKYQGLQTKFSSGMEQNTFYLVSLMRSIPEYEVSYVLTTEDSLEESLKNQKELNDDTPLTILDKLDPQLGNPIVYDLLVHAEAFLPKNFIIAVKKRFPTKFIHWLVGVSMIGLMEDIIYNVENRYTGSPPAWPNLIDEIWISPHHYYQKSYLETISKCHVAVVPYIYEPWFLQKFEELKRKKLPDFNPYYVPNSKKNIGILEPNINLVKNAVIPICIIESLFNNHRDILKEKCGRIYCSEHLQNHQAFQHLFIYLESKNIFSSEARYQIGDILNFDSDIIISHQHLCELNYLYLDALYYNIPLIHNSDRLKDYGYYYPEFDVIKGSEALKSALEEHDHNLERYKDSAHKAIEQFSVKNRENIEGYRSIIESLLAK